jgi:hypothetical protein
MNFFAFKAMGLLVVSGLVFAFTIQQGGTIKGIVSPIEGGIRAWAESPADTLMGNIANGSFEITDVKPGTYRLIIEARPPYKNVSKENVVVTKGQAVDAGEFKLEK